MLTYQLLLYCIAVTVSINHSYTAINLRQTYDRTYDNLKTTNEVYYDNNLK